jgi:hypothetical protein
MPCKHDVEVLLWDVCCLVKQTILPCLLVLTRENSSASIPWSANIIKRSDMHMVN